MAFIWDIVMILVQSIKDCMQWLIPHGLMDQRYLNKSNEKYKIGNEIRNYFLTLNNNDCDLELSEIIHYFKDSKFTSIPYDFTKKYRQKHIGAFYDNSCHMCFVLHSGKKLYFPKEWSLEAASNYYNSLLLEQDEESPHRYETEEYTVKNGEVIVDVGAAEGIWALTYAEKAAKIYLFECEKPWIVALQKTFEPWREKVVIVNKYVSNINTRNETTIDEYFKNKEINFIKADIEGAEIKLLQGSARILSMDNQLKLLLCSYHKKNDADELRIILEKEGFMTEYSKRYIIFIHDKELSAPYVRKGLIRARRDSAFIQRISPALCKSF